ncbi:MAG: hypothetical protein QM741_14730 [Rudaea sp.]|uniref:hypothetical protein n=1 Tax=Rudaea sp. TaxID=2136325 RepID=UPI0039E254F2
MSQLKYVRFCAWTGPLFLLVFIVCWGVLGYNIPPLSAELSAADMAQHFRLHANQVRAGMVGSMTFACLYVVWGLSITKVMEVVEAGRNNVMSTLQLWGAGLTVVPILVSSSFWLAGAYRPEALDASILQLIYDMAWLLIDLAYAVTTLQMFALGVGFLADEREVPLVPKWVSWYSIWVGFMFVIEVLMPYFKGGFLARSGILNFWIEFLIWFFFILVLTWAVLRAVARVEQEATGVARSAVPAGSGRIAAAH